MDNNPARARLHYRFDRGRQQKPKRVHQRVEIGVKVKASKTALRAMLGMSAMAVMLGTSVAPANAIATKSAAQSASCSINGRLPFNHCWTGTIHPHSSQHWVIIRAWPYSGCSAYYRLYDADNGQLVASGQAGENFSRTVYGLYGHYKARFDRLGGLGCGGDFGIANAT